MNLESSNDKFELPKKLELNKDFPKKIPSWLNRDDIRNPEYIALDKEVTV